MNRTDRLTFNASGYLQAGFLESRKHDDQESQNILLRTVSGPNRHITTSQLAEMLDEDYYTVRRWVNGSRRPRLETLLKIAKICAEHGDDALLRHLGKKYFGHLQIRTLTTSMVAG